MLERTSIKVKYYKCFGEESQGFSKILPFNIIIGKNNSGKSTLIELIEGIISLDKKFFQLNGRKIPNIIISQPIEEHVAKSAFPDELVRSNNIPNHSDANSWRRSWIGTTVTYKLSEDGKKELIAFEKNFERHLEDYGKRSALDITQRIKHPLLGKIFKKIASERDIRPEVASRSTKLLSNGEGATNFIQEYLKRSELDRTSFIKKTLFSELNKILNPEINFTDIDVLKSGENTWELYFGDIEGKLIPLSKMGSGIKTIVLILVNLHLLPDHEGRNKSEYVFAFEELENNLHPSLQRRLLKYLKNYQQEHGCIFFLTTHSNIFIDLFSNDEKSQIIHTVQAESGHIASDAVNYISTKEILEDLDVRASDLLQSNGIIWVEGPSDRTYINKWISLIDPTLQDGVHYLIMFYGGKLLSGVHFKSDIFESELIPLLRVNRNAYVVIDRDTKTATSKLRETKNRIKSELGEKSTWITRGLEIENYLTEKSLKNWIEAKYKREVPKLSLNEFQKIESVLSKVSPKINYATKKSKYSKEIAEFIEMEDLDFLNLQEKIHEIVSHIKKWNKQ